MNAAVAAKDKAVAFAAELNQTLIQATEKKQNTLIRANETKTKAAAASKLIEEKDGELNNKTAVAKEKARALLDANAEANDGLMKGLSVALRAEKDEGDTAMKVAK